MARLFDFRVPRRIVSIGGVIVFTALILVLSPLLVVAAAIADRAGDAQGDHRWLRMLTCITLYLLNELAGLTSMLGLWIISGFGLGMKAGWVQRLHGHLHGWWTWHLVWAVDKIFGSNIEIRNADAVEPSPVILLSRHISYLDAVIPSVLVAHGRRNTPRHILMKELRWEPCIDILGSRTPNHFVDRSAGGDDEYAAIRRVGATAERFGSCVIFPEGGFRTPERFARSIERLRASQPELADRAAKLRHVLPPRPNGSRALLEGAAGVDVVVVAHSGFERLNTLRNIASNVPMTQPVVVELKRVPRSEIPTEPQEFHEWLLTQFEWIDAFAERQISGTDDVIMDLRDRPALSNTNP